jgi:hypothetical protein
MRALHEVTFPAQVLVLAKIATAKTARPTGKP